MKFIKQVIILSLISIIFTCPHLLLHGTNIVTQTYQLAASHFMNKISPYGESIGVTDLFKYSPFFSFIYYPLSIMNKSAQATSWGMINIFFFWAGISRWILLDKTKSKWLWAAVIAASMELDGSIRYQQINALLTGLVLIGLAEYRDGRFKTAGFILAVITNIKILPALFLLTLALQLNKKFIFAAVFGLVFTFLIPTFHLGFSQNLQLHHDWMMRLFFDTQSKGLLDIATVLTRYGFENAKEVILIPLGILSVLILVFQIQQKKHFDWNTWISIGFLSLLLVNPRTESPTFVLVGPAYILLTVSALKSMWMKLPSILFVFAGIFLITFCMNDLWPRVIWNAASLHQANKTFGVLLLWTFAVIQFAAIALNAPIDLRITSRRLPSN